MKFTVSLQNFRCFASVDSIPIAPITLLIGENSSGKTSFLAGLRQTIEAFSSAGDSSFNKEPYYLGSFEQIAHYRGGSAGRAKAFSLALAVERDANQPDLFSGRKSASNRALQHRLKFVKGSIKPELERYEISSERISVVFDLSSSRPKITIIRDGTETIQLDPTRVPSSLLMRREIAYFGFYLQEFVARSRIEEEKKSSPDSFSLIDSAAQMLRTSSRMLTQSVFASAPVRIQPRRVYTPSELASLNAGEQVPLEMAREKIESADEWIKTRARLSEFGKRAGLFDDIDVKRLGKTDSDPFQLQIKNKGPFSNIVDVGYGVSQAIPLLYPLQKSREYSVYLLQQPEVHLHPRAQAEFGSLITDLSQLNPSHNYVIETHSDFIVDRIRSDVRTKKIDPTSISILLFKRRALDTEIIPMSVNENGEIINCPDDYREFFLEEEAKILGL